MNNLTERHLKPVCINENKSAHIIWALTQRKRRQINNYGK